MVKAAIYLIVLASLVSAGCSNSASTKQVSSVSLTEARRGFVTNIITKTKNHDPVPAPAPGFEVVHYRAPLGPQPAILSLPTIPGKRHPAIIWIVGGFDNSVGDTPWAPATPDNDQSARAFPAADIITMYPSLRGGNNNAGYQETFYGEVDDILAAEKYLATRHDVDPSRIYLGGHSTGGTLAMLVAESTHAFRAVFAFGAIASPDKYGQDNCTFDISNSKENDLRSPIMYLSSITSPTFAFEGSSEGNLDSLRQMCGVNRNPVVHFYEIPGETHFSTLAKVTPVIAKQIAADTGPKPKFSFLMPNPQIIAASAK